jgi:cell division protein FtsL
MIQRYVPILTVLLVLAATSLFNVKYAVVAAEGEISRIEQEIEAEHWRLRTLEADWAHLARAERLAAQARALGMAPVTLDRVVEAEQIGDYRLLQLARQPRLAELPEGEQLEFRVKPVTAFELSSLADRRDLLGQGW